MLEWEQMCRFTKVYDLISNRIGIINEVLGRPLHHSHDNPMRLDYTQGRYSVTFDGSRIADFGVYDLDGASSALAVLDAWQDCLWRCKVGCHVAVV